MVPAFCEEKPGERTQGVGAEAASLEGTRDRDVDGGMPVIGIGFLCAGDDASQHSTYLDGERHHLGVHELVEYALAVAVAPPAGDGRIIQNREDRWRKIFPKRSQDPPSSLEVWKIGLTHRLIKEEGGGRD